MTQPPFHERHGRWIVALGCALLPLVVLGAKRALDTNHNDVGDWLPASYSETADYRWFRRHFGNDEFVLVTWEGCTIDDSRLDLLAERLRNREVSTEAGPARFGRVVTGRSVLDELTASRADLTREDTAARLRGSLVGPDGRQSCAMVFLAEDSGDLQAVLDAARQAALDCGAPADSVRFGGQPAIIAAVDQVSARAFDQVIATSFVVVLLIAWWSIRDVRLIILVVATGVYSAVASLALLTLCGARMDAILVTMIPMVYVAATSGAIHLCNYYVESVRDGGLPGAAGRAVAHAWLPLGLATATTAAGLLSICYNDLVLIQRFGVYSAMGVGLSWLMMVLWLPALLTVWPGRKVETALDERSAETGAAPLPSAWRRLGEFVTAHPAWFLTGCLALLAACTPGLSRLNVSIDPLTEFRPDEEIIRTYAWLEEKLGPLIPMEVVLRIDDGACPLNTSERLRLVAELQQRMEVLDGVGGTVSAATFVPDSRIRAPAWLRQGIVNVRLKKDRARLLDTGYLAEADGEELWRISVRVSALRDVDYSAFVNDLRAAIQPELDAVGSGITPVFTGVAPVLFKARHSLVDGLAFGILTDLVLIVVTITATLRHWSSGLLMLLTSVFPAFVVLGGAGWLGVRVDLGALMAPCVALGVTVDDVIHFLLWYRWGAERGLGQRQAVLLAWQACVRPMYQSWALLGLGMAALGVSAFVPILQFGALMAAMLTVGLAGNLFLLPALLAGPLGKVIATRSRAVPEQTAHGG